MFCFALQSQTAVALRRNYSYEVLLRASESNHGSASQELFLRRSPSLKLRRNLAEAYNSPAIEGEGGPYLNLSI